MACECSPQSRTGPSRTQWSKDFDWGPAPSTVVAGQETVDGRCTLSARGFGFGNCTVVLPRTGDGGAVVGQYNYYSDGTYDTRVIPPRAADAILHIRDEAVPGGARFTPRFFFQAEDGIRDLTVTGVQTCALPI